MNELLLDLLCRLEAIGKVHNEIYDSDCRDEMREAVHNSFLDPLPDYSLPTDYCLATEEGNLLVREAISHYTIAAKAKAELLGLTFKSRLLALQSHKVITESGTTSDEFFGYTSPDLFTETGEWLGGN